MTSRKEEELNEKIIRGLMKLPPNRKCINCNSIGPQYVCTNFWTFVCTACSGIHREFTHRVKSVSMAKFTSQEVDALQKGGNQRAREIFLKDWDTQLQRLPDSSNVDRMREFIKNVYVNRKYAGGRSSDKPPRDVQSQKNNDDDTRRASSYHSYSQSPPYDNQYEDRRYGKQVGVLTRKPGSDRGLYEGKISSFVYSPGHSEQMYEDRSANEGSIGRASDYSVSSAGDPFRYDTQSPNFQKDGGFSSPPIQPFRDILIEDTRHRTMNIHPDANSARNRTTSSGSSGSFDSNSASLKTINSGSLLDIVLEPEQSILVQQAGKSTFPSLPQSSSSAGVVSQDPFDLSLKQPPSSATSIDLFASITHQNSLTTNLEKNPSASSFSENVGWATFDLPLPAASNSEAKREPQSHMPLSHGISKGDFVPHLFTNNTMQQPSVNGSTMNVPYPSMFNQWNGSVNEVHTSTRLTKSQPWNAFGSSSANLSQASFENLSQKSEPQISVYAPTSGTHIESSEVLEDLSNGFKRSTIEDLAPPSLPFNGVNAGSSFPPLSPMDGSPPLSHDQRSTNPFDLPHDSDLEPTSMFLNMNSLQTSLPNSPFPLTYVSGVPEPWFPQSSATPIVDAVPQGGLTYMVGQAPTSQLLNDHSQGPVASFGGNPFA